MSGLLVGEVVRSAAGAAPHRPAVVLGGRALTFAALDAGADQAAGRLAALGVRRGDRVVWPSAGDPVGTLRVYAGAARAGAVLVPLARDAWSARVVRAAAPCLVLTDAEGATEGARLATAARVRHAVLAEDAVRTDGDRPGEPREPEAAEAAEAPEEKDPHLVLFAGKGRTRGVVLSHRASVLRAHCG
ncbi:AMP-binding protein, partial [Streptomyces spectabilis]